jgi:signal transduction histidine kinase
MDEHHGTISIDSQPEQGTTLTLTLPATAAT